MRIYQECRKAKRTGVVPAFLAGGILAAAFPCINMAVRSEMFIHRQGSPVTILLTENWQVMSLLNVILVVLGACLLYHTEFASNAMQKMKCLPVSESSIFYGKTGVICFLSVVMLVMEAASVVFCSLYWFDTGSGIWPEVVKSFGYSFLMGLPCILLSLLVSSACRNMWVSLGIGVVCIFTATILPSDNFALSLFPYALPFSMFDGADVTGAMHHICAAAVETAVMAAAELLFIKIRRVFE